MTLKPGKVETLHEHESTEIRNRHLFQARKPQCYEVLLGTAQKIAGYDASFIGGRASGGMGGMGTRGGRRRGSLVSLCLVSGYTYAGRLPVVTV